VIPYAQFYQSVEAIRRHLVGLNLPVGSTAVVMIGHMADHWCACLALRSLGLHTVPVFSMAQADALNLRDVVLVLTTEAERPHRDLRSATLAGVPFEAVGMAAFAGLQAIPLDVPPSLPAPFGGHTLQSSGTTGQSKRLFIPGEHQAAHCREQAGKWRFGTETVYNCLEFPSSTMIGYHAPPAVWSMGGTVRFDQRRDWPAHFMDHGTTAAFVLPPMIRDIHAAWAATGQPPLDCTLFPGGGFVSQELLALGKACFSRPMRLVYGSTELTTYSLSQELAGPEDLLWLTPADRQVQVVDEQGQEVPAGAEGEFRIRRHPTDCAAYVEDPVTSAAHFRGDWFHPGDLAMQRRDGRVRILGRIGDVLVVSGRKVPATPLEQRLQRLLGVQEVCLFGRLNEAGQEELVIAIQAPAAPPEAMLAGAREEFSGHFQLVRCVVLPRFPRTATAMAKVRRAELRRIVFGEATGPDC
jgi:acyl-coenzyme A synthetase/AMP-(fatty) acid ligase